MTDEQRRAFRSTMRWARFRAVDPPLVRPSDMRHIALFPGGVTTHDDDTLPPPRLETRRDGSQWLVYDWEPTPYDQLPPPARPLQRGGLRYWVGRLLWRVALQASRLALALGA
jgi:hypothetical protein